MRIYLAGPDVFLPNAIEMGQRKRDICARHGMTGLFPLDNAIDLAAPDASRTIFLANQAMMDGADAIIANLTPFRGPSADPGTVYELGYMAGLGRPCFGYSNDHRSYFDRVGRGAHDPNGHNVENFGLADNLMIVHALGTYGEPLVTKQISPDAIWHDLSAFEDCVRRVADHAKRRVGNGTASVRG